MAVVGVGVVVAPISASVVSPQRAQSVSLESIEGQGGRRTYIASVFDSEGQLIGNADLDLGALGSDPDLRVPTVAMPMSADKSYRVNVVIPANGDWVVVVRVHSPTQLVELFTDKVDDSSAADLGHSASSFSRAAVVKADPTFFERYSLSQGSTVGDLHTAGVESASTLHVGETSRALDPTGVISMLAHSAGAIAWLLAVLGLVVANRVGPGVARNELLNFVAVRYRLLAGGGLLVLLVTGLINIDRSSNGLLHPRTLLDSNLGTLYLAVFCFKLVLFAASLVTTRRIDRIVNSSDGGFTVATNRTAGSVDVAKHTILLRLAETNLMLGASILVAITLLGQLHQALH